jgi:hypothetical protein
MLRVVDGIELRRERNLFDTETTAFPNAHAGATLKLVATSGAKSASLELVCPQRVTITAPAPGAAVKVGNSLEMTWTENLETKHEPGSNHWAQIQPFDEKGRSLGAKSVLVKDDQHSVKREVPTSVAPASYFAQLAILGVYANTPQGRGYCGLIQSVPLTSQRPPRARCVLGLRARRRIMARFMDVHTGMKGIDKKGLAEAHKKDSQHEAAEGVKFLHSWADPSSGKVFCLSEGPSKDAVLRVHKKAGHAPDEIYEVPIEVE